MFLVMLSNFVPLSRDLPLIEALFLCLTLLLVILTIPITIVDFKASKLISKVKPLLSFPKQESESNITLK